MTADIQQDVQGMQQGDGGRTADVCAGAPVNDDIKVLAAAARILANVALCIGLIDGLLEGKPLIVVFTPEHTTEAAVRPRNATVLQGP